MSQKICCSSIPVIIAAVVTAFLLFAKVESHTSVLQGVEASVHAAEAQAPNITLLSPNGGEIIAPNAAFDIT